MTWNYHKQIKIIPGVYLSFSKSGISTTIGVKQANIHSGTTPIPFSDARNHPVRPAPGDNIFSADIQQITSQNMQGIKEAMLMAYQQRIDLGKDLEKIRQTLGRTKLKLNISYLLLYGLINKSIATKIKADIAAQEEAIRQIQQQVTHSCVSLEVQFEPEILETYNQVVSTFKQLITSHKIWDVTSAHHQDRVIARSSASTIVSKKEVRFGIKSLPDIRSDFEVLYFQNANGSDLYFYPGFIVMHASKNNFALIGMMKWYWNMAAYVLPKPEQYPATQK